MDCFSEIKKHYSAKKVLILGLGLQGGGSASALFFAKLGCEVLISDLKTKVQLEPSVAKLQTNKNIRFHFGPHDQADIDWADLIIKNPGVKDSSPIMQYALSKNKEVTMPSPFFLKHCPVFTIGITGTRGKSTTTNMIYEVLKQLSAQKVHLAGNIPQHSPFDLIAKLQESDIVVMELSSWELAGLVKYKVSPNIAVITNFYPDHLNYYDSLESYIDDKLNIFRFQKENDYFITHQKNITLYREKFQNLKAKQIIVDDNYFPEPLEALVGQHNLENAALALRVAEILKLPKEQAVKIIKAFQPLHFRLELLGKIENTLVYNDTTSTTPIACQKAIEALAQKYPARTLSLILGGNSKNLPLEKLPEIVNKYVSTVYLLPGSMTEEIKPLLSKKLNIVNISNFSEAFASSLEKKTGILILSPGATSFASFKNEFDRGEQFNDTFKTFKNKHGREKQG